MIRSQKNHSLRLKVGSNLILLERTTPTTKEFKRARGVMAPHTVETAKDRAGAPQKGSQGRRVQDGVSNAVRLVEPTQQQRSSCSSSK